MFTNSPSNFDLLKTRA